MKTLVLIRHAKSLWDGDNSDINRPLSNRGINDANLLSNEFKKHNFIPDAVYSSAANRALTTCNIFLKTLEISENRLTIFNQLYDFEGQQVLGFIKHLDDYLDKVMIFGHNYALTAVSNLLGNIYIDNLPTCGLVMINFDTNSWKNIDKGHHLLTIFPKHLKA